MPRYIDLTGQQFNDWTVLEYKGTCPKSRTALWECRCVCGLVKEVRAQHLRSGNSKGCGCTADKRFSEKLTTHGLSKSSESTIWRGIKTRCYSKNSKHWKNYGGRGITMCQEWRDSFEQFYADMGPRPSKKHSIERIDNDGSYCPENCKWATRYEQNRNHRRNHMLTYNGETKCLTDWATSLGITQQAMQDRLKKWPVERALSEPVNKAYQRK